MIIGISGKIGSGKDTIGEIIRFLLTNESRVKRGEKPLEFDTFRFPSTLTNHNRWDESGFTTKKFADKVKEFAASMTGIPRQDWELQTIKDAYLPSEWNQFYLKFKDGRPDEVVPEGKDPVAWQRRFAHVGEVYVKQMTGRELLQKLGTDAIRNKLHYNAWRNATLSDYKPYPRERIMEDPMSHLSEAYQGTCKRCEQKFLGYKRQRTCAQCANTAPDQYPDWIITDVRFPNEVPAINLLIRVVRPNAQLDMEHHSETALDTYPFRNIIQNDGTLEDLIIKVKDLLIIKGLL